MENTNPNSCGAAEGSLPGSCASMVFPYVAMQRTDPARYDQQEALYHGTLFPGLNLPFFRTMQTRMNCDNTAMCELMALYFAVNELGLYLDTHQDDSEALELYRRYVALAREGRDKYEAAYGPLTQTAVGAEGWSWLNNPWPWEYEGGTR